MTRTPHPAAQRELAALVVFDIDGTLTDTMGIDHGCFARAYGEVFDGAAMDDDFEGYEHVTDAGIFTESFRRSFDRDPTADESEMFKSRFLELFGTAVARDASSCPPIAGADTIFATLRNEGFAIALATGSWRRAARLKLETAGVPVDVTPMACGEDGISRRSILNAAISRAADVHGRSFSFVVSVGDGVWDARAASELGHAFIGIGNGQAAQRLREAGAHAVFESYADEPGFQRACSEACARAPDWLPPRTP